MDKFKKLNLSERVEYLAKLSASDLADLVNQWAILETTELPGSLFYEIKRRMTSFAAIRAQVEAWRDDMQKSVYQLNASGRPRQKRTAEALSSQVAAFTRVLSLIDEKRE